jgi:triphosphatase
MQNEIEIKLIVSSDIEETLTNLSKKQDVKLVSQQFELENIYFDTPDKKLRNWDMGLRIRVNDAHIEQTIKTAGEVIGGLHQRPEYNIDIESKVPVLSLFPQQIWAPKVCIEQLQREITPLFATNFSRQGFMMIYPDGAIVEMVFDRGVIVSEGRSVDICEVELELVKGKPELIFELASALAKNCPLRFGVDSKAARGYLLAKNQQHQVNTLGVVDIKAQDTLETAYIKSVNHGLAHWQRHIEVFIEQHDFRAISEIRKALSLIIKANELYQDYFHDNELKALTKSLFWLMEQLAFIDDYLRIDMLLENGGSKFKKLAKQDEILVLLAQEHENLPSITSLIALFNSEKHTQLVASLMQWLYFKPWQQQSLPSLEKFQTRLLRKQAASFLAQDWELVHQSLPLDSDLNYQDYLAQRLNLQHNLQVGLCVGEIFDEQARLRFRAPWLDITYGIDQLLQFEPIKQLLRREKLIDDGSVQKWLSRKEESLIHAMEQSRKKALKLTPYWID